MDVAKSKFADRLKPLEKLKGREATHLLINEVYASIQGESTHAGRPCVFVRTSVCNQRCSYCYNDWRADNGRSVGALPHAELLAVVQRALTELSLDHVTLTGGETFARADVFDVLDLCPLTGAGHLEPHQDGHVILDHRSTVLVRVPDLDGATRIAIARALPDLDPEPRLLARLPLR